MTIPLIVASMLCVGDSTPTYVDVLCDEGLVLVVSHMVHSIEAPTSIAAPSSTTDSPHVVDTAI